MLLPSFRTVHPPSLEQSALEQYTLLVKNNTHPAFINYLMVLRFVQVGELWAELENVNLIAFCFGIKFYNSTVFALFSPRPIFLGFLYLRYKILAFNMKLYS